MLIEGGRIVEIEKKIDPPAGAQIIDCTGQSILPGLIVEHQVYIDPTIIVFEGTLPGFKPLTENWADYLSVKTAEIFQESIQKQYAALATNACQVRAVQKQKQFIKALFEAGGILVGGTDPIPVNLIPGFAMHREMANLVDAGMPPLEAIKAATLNAVKALRLEKEIGTLEIGKQADILLVKGRPDRRIEDIGNTMLVFRKGLIYHPEELRKPVMGLIGQRSTDLILEDMQTAIRKIMAYTENMDQKDFAADEKTIDAVFRNFFTLGEAAGLVPGSIREQYPAIPWDFLNYYQEFANDQYYNVEPDSFWWIFKNWLPGIEQQLTQIINSN